MSCREQSAADLNVVASEHARDWLGVPPFVTASGGALALGVSSSTIRSYENGTVLKRQFWLRGLFVADSLVAFNKVSDPRRSSCGFCSIEVA